MAVFDSVIEDVAGRYTTGTGASGNRGGGSELIMKNSSGVEIRMSATERLVYLKAGVYGVKLSLKQ